MEELSPPPPPPPRLVLPDEQATEPLASFNARHRRRHFPEFRHSLHSSTSPSPSPSSGQVDGSTSDDDHASNTSSVGLRERLVAKLQRTRTVENDDANQPTSAIVINDSRSQNLRDENTESKDLYRWAVMVENQRG